MNDLLDRIDADPLAAVRPQSAHENERALAFALELTEGSPALDAVRGRGILASMIAEQREHLEARARLGEQARTGFSRPSHRVTPAARTNRVSAEGSFALPATLRSANQPNGSNSRISANTEQNNGSGQFDRSDSVGASRARAMSAAPAALLGNSVRGPQGQRLRTVDAPAYGRLSGQSTGRGTTQAARPSQSQNGSENRGQNIGQHPVRHSQLPDRRVDPNLGQGTGRTRRYATNGSLALAEPEFASHSLRHSDAEAPTPRPSLRVLSGGKVVGSTRKKVLGSLAVVAAVTIAFAAVFMHAGLARTQLGIDKLNIEITQAERMNQRLRVQVATLEAPDRIVSVAQELGLEPPKTVRFLPTAAPMALAATRIVR
jgi:cell division protein FtsL